MGGDCAGDGAEPAAARRRDGTGAGDRRRLAATVLSAAGLVAAVLACVSLDGGRGGGGAGRRDVLLSARQRRELRDATALKRIHASYDRAKGRLERMSTEYTGLGAKLQASESRVGQLRTELEDKMREIRGDIRRGGVKLADSSRNNRARGMGGFTTELAEAPPARRDSAGLEHEVRELKSEVRRLDAKEAAQATALREMRRGSLAAADAASGGGDARRTRSAQRPVLALAAKRVMGTEKLASLARLQSVNLQLEAENRRICKLCAKSAMLRINRQQTCGICAQYAPGEVRGDTDLEGYPRAQSSTSSLVGQAINMFVSGWKPQQADLRPAQPAMEDESVGARAEASGSTRAEMRSVIQELHHGAPGFADATVTHLFPSPAQQQLVQIDDGEHMGAMGGPMVTALIDAGGNSFVVGKCALSADEVKFSSWQSLCDTCKSQLGPDVEGMGNAVRCEHPPA